MNRYKTAKQSLPILSWIIGCSVAACIVGFGIKFLMVKYQVFQGGKTVKDLEVQLARLNTSNDNLQAKIVKYTAGPELEKKHVAGYIKLRKIVDEKDVVRAGRDDKTVSWKSGVAVVESRQTASTRKADEPSGGNR